MVVRMATVAASRSTAPDRRAEHLAGAQGHVGHEDDRGVERGAASAASISARTSDRLSSRAARPGEASGGVQRPLATLWVIPISGWWSMASLMAWRSTVMPRRNEDWPRGCSWRVARPVEAC